MSIPAVHAATPGEKYFVGTLRYTKASLFVLFGWLLWGDFCFNLMEKVWPSIFPLYLLKVQGTSNTTANLFVSVIPQAMLMLLCPIISFRSDRTRSRWGRRMPYMIFTAPFLCLFLVAMGFIEPISQYLKTSSLPAMLHLSPATAILLVLGFLTIGFSFFNDFVSTVYYYLFADVVPQAFLGRFLGLFRIVAIAADFVFRRYIYQYSLTHMQWIFLGAALLYIVGFSLMCWRVKEGEYPPVTDVTERTGIPAQIRLYFSDCFTHPIYVLLFLQSAFKVFAGTAGIGTAVFLLSLNVDLATQGTVGSWMAILCLVISYPFGWIVDRFHPLRVTMFATILGVPIAVASFFWMQDYWSYVAFGAIGAAHGMLANAAGIPSLIALFPAEKFGQFSSANAMVRSFAGVLGGLAAGPFLDYVTRYGQSPDHYRYMYAWSGVFNALALMCMFLVYQMWKQRGGATGYVAPGSVLEREQTAPQPPVPAFSVIK